MSAQQLRSSGGAMLTTIKRVATPMTFQQLFPALLVSWVILIPLIGSSSRAQSPPVKEAEFVMHLDVDAAECTKRVFAAQLRIPVRAGPFAFQYPKWIPGTHGPTGPITQLSALTVSAHDKPIAWRRDVADMYMFRCDVPAGVETLEVRFEFLVPIKQPGLNLSACTLSTDAVAVVNWNALLLYPAGMKPREIKCAARLRLPDGWKYATALSTKELKENWISFEPASAETLVDSPVIAGKHFTTLNLGGADDPHSHQLHVAADHASSLESVAALAPSYRRLISETHLLFGAKHYRSYHFLLTLSNELAGGGLEHTDSSLNRLPAHALSDDDQRVLKATRLPHEFVHAWNGKYRRPVDHAADDYQRPTDNRLLWVYEGLTQYLGIVLSARSGLLTTAEVRDQLALLAADTNFSDGRRWRPLGDTAVASQLFQDDVREWSSARRGADYYNEGLMIWLEADALIRTRTKGQKSLDDFCRLFFGPGSGASPYTQADLVAAMNQLLEHDWEKFFIERVSHSGRPDLDFRAAGWLLQYHQEPTSVARYQEGTGVNLVYSVGLRIGAAGEIVDVVPNSPAAAAGAVPGMRIIAVNGRQFTRTALLREVNATRSTGALELILQNADSVSARRIRYSAGARYPYLVRHEPQLDSLAETLKARAIGK